LPQPGRLGHNISHTAILGFDAGPRDRVLALGRLGDEAIPEEHGIAQGGLAGVGTTGPVSVGVDNQIELG
jgi:hypothetical protein